MRAQDYINSKLQELKKPLGLVIPKDDKLETEIVRLILSKKFRKYSASPKLIERVKKAVQLNISKQESMKLTFMHGAYKLWRLDEAPETDWAELFALMYFAKWLKFICEIYKPGVWLDIYVDDTIQKRINNLTDDEVIAYMKSQNNLLNFLKKYLPQNFKLTVTKVSDQFGGEESLNRLIDIEVENTELPELNESLKRTIETNVRLASGQDADPQWREKVKQLHGAAMTVKRNGNYAYAEDDKILFFTKPVPIPADLFLAVGTTKNSIVNFWIGVGALKPKMNSFEMTILSPSQLEKADFNFENITLEGLSGKNFSRIRVIDEGN